MKLYNVLYTNTSKGPDCLFTHYLFLYNILSSKDSLNITKVPFSNPLLSQVFYVLSC